jgi:hypothetical protein
LPFTSASFLRFSVLQIHNYFLVISSYLTYTFLLCVHPHFISSFGNGTFSASGDCLDGLERIGGDRGWVNVLIKGGGRAEMGQIEERKKCPLPLLP